MLKKRFVAVLLVLTVAITAMGCSGCNSSWWADFKNNPSAQVQAFEQSAQTALDVADVVWSSVKQYLPADVLVKAQPRYDQAVLAVHKSLTILSDAVAVAVETQNAHPDFGKLIKDVSDAIVQVVAIVNEFRATPAPAMLAPGVPPRPAQPAGLDELNASVTTMKRVGGQK